MRGIVEKFSLRSCEKNNRPLGNFNTKIEDDRLRGWYDIFSH